MGRVFLARSPGGRRVAVKLIRSELAGEKDFRARFAREVRAASRVSGAFTAPVIDAYNTPSGMAEGYRCTVNDEIKTISASGQIVSGRFVAHEARNGVRTEQTFRFSYLVSGNEIKSGRQHLLAGKAPPGCA